MANAEKIGRQLVSQAFVSKRKADRLFDNIGLLISRLNTTVKSKALKIYNETIDRMTLIPGSKLVESSISNFDQIPAAMTDLDFLHRYYRDEWSKRYYSIQLKLFETLKDKEQRIESALKRLGIFDDRVTMSQENLERIDIINRQAYTQIEATLAKWRRFAYDTLFAGVSQQVEKDILRGWFLNPSGTLKIGSSLEEETQMAAAIAVTRQRTSFLQQKAKENGYTYCWNVNPMDQRTKPDCISATLAGVIPEVLMGTDYAFPPRFVCRCELAYVSKDWKELNRGINNELENVRERLLNDLYEAPKQMSQWTRTAAGVTTLIVPKDSVRAAGNKPYKDIEDRINLVEGAEVPEFRL